MGREGLLISMKVSRQAKITELEGSILGQKQIGQLQIPVDYPATVQKGNPLQELYENKSQCYQ